MPEISYRIGLCSQNGPRFTSYMNPTAEKYMFVSLSRATMLALVTSPGSGELGRDPSVGVMSDSEIAGDSWADPKMYGTKEWSSRPQTPCDPAGSRV